MLKSLLSAVLLMLPAATGGPVPVGGTVTLDGPVPAPKPNTVLLKPKSCFSAVPAKPILMRSI